MSMLGGLCLCRRPSAALNSTRVLLVLDCVMLWVWYGMVYCCVEACSVGLCGIFQSVAHSHHWRRSGHDC